MCALDGAVEAGRHVAFRAAARGDTLHCPEHGPAGDVRAAAGRPGASRPGHRHVCARGCGAPHAFRPGHLWPGGDRCIPRLPSGAAAGSGSGCAQGAPPDRGLLHGGRSGSAMRRAGAVAGQGRGWGRARARLADTDARVPCSPASRAGHTRGVLPPPGGRGRGAVARPAFREGRTPRARAL